MIDVAANWQAVCARVAAAARRAGRDPQSVRIIAVSKTKPVEMIEAAIAAGATDIGENYVQEAAEKIRRITAPVRWQGMWRHWPQFFGKSSRTRRGWSGWEWQPESAWRLGRHVNM